MSSFTKSESMFSDASDAPINDAALFDGRYEILSTIAEGRNSIVYRARINNGEHAHQEVALKVLSSGVKDIDRTKERLKREALSMLSCRNEHVIKLFDFVSRGDQQYLCLQLAEQGDLKRLLKERGPFPPFLALHYTRQLLAGLDAIHRAGIVHCDIKPDNILLTADDTIKITDFGIAALPSQQDLTEEITRGVGTLNYLSPETLHGKSSGPQSDLYSVGITLYELLTGHTPYEGTTIAEQIERKLEGDCPPLSYFLPDLPAGLQRLINRALAVHPEDRFQNAPEFIAAISKIEQTSTANPSRAGGFSATIKHIAHSGAEVRAYLRRTITDQPFRFALLSATCGVLFFLTMARITGSGLAMLRTTPQPDPAPIARQIAAPRTDRGPIRYVGVLYDLFGEKQDVAFALTDTGNERQALVVLGVTGWVPQVIDIGLLEPGNSIKLYSGGLQLSLASSPRAPAVGSIAGGEYRELGTRRSGRWALFPE